VVGPIRFDGPVSGINYTAILNSVLQGVRAPETIYKGRITSDQTQKNALLDVNISLLALKSSADALALPSFFASTTVTSGNDAVLGATGSSVATQGSFTFGVQRLAQSHQLISNGFADANTTAVTTTGGTISLKQGGGFLDRQTAASFLNDQTGITRGSIKVTDSSGSSAVVNLQGAVSVQDVLDALNGATGVAVTASVAGNRLVVQDKAGGTGSLQIGDVGGGTTASSLGIAGTSSPGSGVIYGSDINTVNGSTKLALLNDGLGVRRAASGADFRITDAHGVSFDVQLQATDNTLDQVIARINGAASAASSTLTASLESGGNSLVLKDSGSGTVAVQSLNNSFAATDLGLGVIKAGAFQGNVSEDLSDTTGTFSGLVGSSLIPSLNTTLRTLLNGGQNSFDPANLQGVPDGAITLTDRSGASASVDISAAVVTSASSGALAGAASLNVGDPNGFAVGNRFRVHTSAGLEYRTVTGISGNTITFDQGLTGSVASGNNVVALNDSLNDIVRTLNDRTTAAGVKVHVDFNAAGDGLRVTDLSGVSTGPLSVTGAAAADLGIQATVAASTLSGSDLHPQYLGDATRLSSLGGGQGVSAGSFRISDAHGIQFDVSLSNTGTATLGQVISSINAASLAAGSGVVARINNTGNGLLLQDTAAAPSGVLGVQDLNAGHTAGDLNIAASASGSAPSLIDGSFEKQITIAAGATLQNIADAINQAKAGVTAQTFTDDSSSDPARMTLISNKTGAAGRIVIDTSIAGLSFSTTTAAQDAILVSGSQSGGASPALITSSSNTITGVVPGLTLQLNGVSDSPVTISVTRNTDAIVKQVQAFVDGYNAVTKKISGYTSFDPTTFTTGPLFGDSGIREIRNELSTLIVSPVSGLSPSSLNTLASIGVSVNGQGALSLDTAQLGQQLSTNFDQVRSLFTQPRQLSDSTLLKDFNSGSGVAASGGPDFQVTAGDGTTFSVTLAGARSVGDLLDLINTAAGNGGKVAAQVSPDGFSIELIDRSTAHTVPFSVQNLGGSQAASQLKISNALPLGQTVLKGGVISLPNAPGIAAQFRDRLDFFTQDTTGLIAGETIALDASVTDLNNSISQIELKATAVQNTLVREFSNLETLIANSQLMSQQLAALNGTTTSSGTSASTGSSLGSSIQATGQGGSTSGAGTSSTG